ncbi:hypothetical protein M422DRAFT_215377, partial [Sphaerobolus stellatus SS14]
MNYPERKGWAWDELMGYQNYGNRTRESVAAFFQTWLYFGTLISVFSVCDIQVKMTDFICEDEQGKKLITTQKLPEMIQEWVNREGVAQFGNKDTLIVSKHGLLDMDNEVRHRRGNMIHTYLTRVLKFVDKYCNTKAQQEAEMFGTSPEFWPMDPVVALSIMAIGVPLSKMLLIIYNMPEPGPWGSSFLLNQRMKDMGWCIRDIPIKISGSSRIDRDYYFSSYPSPRRNLDHTKCDEVVCRANNVDVKVYATKHVIEGCDCPHMHVPMEDLLDVIKAAGIPIIHWRDGKIKITRYDEKNITKYIAISHVWSDGLGNEEQSSLPTCQLSRLQGMVDGLFAEAHYVDEDYANEKAVEYSSYVQVGFWIDTLCVPVGNDYVEYRQATIRQMGSIYKAAHCVLVLDSRVFEVPSSADILNKILRLYLANWHRRLWTFQEGLFAKSLFFQFSDKALTLDEMAEEYTQYYSQAIPHLYSSVGDSFTEEFLGLYKLWAMLGMVKSGNFEWFVQEVGRRTTTKQQDESICLSTLMGLDPGELFKHKGDARMACFYKMVGGFKPQIIFNPFPRLPIRGFGWAPISFVGQ